MTKFSNELVYLFTEYPKVLNHTVTLEPPFPVERDFPNFICTVLLNTNVSTGSIKWYTGGHIIKNTNGRVTEEHWNDGYEYRSHLTLRAVSGLHSGLYLKTETPI